MAVESVCIEVTTINLGSRYISTYLSLVYFSIQKFVNVIFMLIVFGNDNMILIPNVSKSCSYS